MHDLFIPVMGMAPDDVTLVTWLIEPGATVSAGQPVAVVETSKAELEIESEADGVLGRHLVAEMEQVAPGTTIARLLVDGEAETEAGASAAPHAAGPDSAGPDSAGPDSAGPEVVRVEGAIDDAVGAGAAAAVAAAAAETGERTPHQLSPRARRVAAESPTAAVRPAGETVTAPATTAVSSAAPQPTDADARYRDAISAAVTRSWQEIPHFAVTRELRVAALVTAARDLRAVVSSVTMTDLLLRALALSFIEREQRTDLDVGLAVATDRGVAIPVIRDVARMDLFELVSARHAATQRAKAGRLHPDDGRIPVTTLSNLGAVGVDQFTGVVPYGQTSMLTVGRAAPRPAVSAAGELEVATTMQATLNVDHRSWDGLHAGQLLDRLARIVALPALLSNVGPSHFPAP